MVMITDQLGNPLSEGDSIAYPVNQVLEAEIVKLPGGLTLPNQPPGPPMVVLRVAVTLMLAAPAPPDGKLQVFKIEKPKP